MIERTDGTISFKRRCELLDISRGSMYYMPVVKQDNSSEIIHELREVYEEAPFYGYRRMTVALREKGFLINHKRVLSLLQIAGIKAIYPKKNTSIRNFKHKIFPYLLKNLVIERPNQVWQVDITYIKIHGGFVYLTCLIDIFSRKIMGWKLSTFLDTAACLDALNSAIKLHKPEIINSDQGCQFTSDDWIKTLQENDIQISMDGKGRWADNIYIERLWRTIKYEMVYLYSFETIKQINDEINRYISFYNTKRYHSCLNYHTPDFIFSAKTIPTTKDLFENFLALPQIQQETPMF